jgi:hypothetical protein
MALKLSDSNYYIKIDLHGNFKIYKTMKDRALEKKAPKFEDISLKYTSIIKSFRQDRERRYYDPNFVKTLLAWEKEAELYSSSYIRGLHVNNFPLMSKYIPNIAQSLPNIISIGHIWVKGETLAEVYEYVKKVGYFKNVVDC